MIQQPQFYSPYNQYATPPSASAVNIQIFEPRAYGNAPVPVQQPQYQPQYQPYSQPIYQYPQMPIYPQLPPVVDQQAMTPIAPQTPIYVPQQPIYQTPVQPYQPVSNEAPQPVLVQPEPSVVSTQPQNVAQEQNVVVPPLPTEAKAVSPVEKVEIEKPNAVQTEKIDLTALNNELKSDDLNTQTDAIVKIAQLTQSTPDVALQVVDKEVMQNLMNIIKKDTTKMQGLTQQQINISQKIKNGEKLTPSEQAIAEQNSPREVAEKNKVFALYTLSMLQKLLRDEVDTYNTDVENTKKGLPTSTGKPVEGNPLPLDITPFAMEVMNAVEADGIPAIKAAGIQALSNVASKPEDKALLEKVIGKYVYDQDPDVSQAAKNALVKVGTV